MPRDGYGGTLELPSDARRAIGGWDARVLCGAFARKFIRRAHTIAQPRP